MGCWWATFAKWDAIWLSNLGYKRNTTLQPGQPYSKSSNMISRFASLFLGFREDHYKHCSHLSPSTIISISQTRETPSCSKSMLACLSFELPKIMMYFVNNAAHVIMLWARLVIAAIIFTFNHPESWRFSIGCICSTHRPMVIKHHYDPSCCISPISKMSSQNFLASL